MCGRYSVAITVKDKNNKASRVARLLEKYQLKARYNYAPSQLLPVVTADKPDQLQFFSWGLVPADGFYEWRKTASGKVPYRFLLKSEELFSFAGLWDEWADTETGEMQRTFTIITTEANELVKPTHDRMPVILSPEKEETWLDVTKGNNMLQQFLQPFPAEEMKSYAVSSLVNSVNNNSASLIKQVPEQVSFFKLVTTCYRLI